MKSFKFQEKFEQFIHMYLDMKVGMLTVRCPYWSNKIQNGLVTVRGYEEGKGVATLIGTRLNTVVQAYARQYPSEKIDNLLIMKLAKRNKIGIDCSGLAYRIMEFLLQSDLNHGKIRNLEIIFSGGARKTNVQRITSSNYCIKVDNLLHIQIGDMIRMMGGKHVVVITDITKKEITYIHSSHRSEICGVHTGKISITNSEKDLSYQKWNEKTVNHENWGQSYFHPENGDGIYRLKVFNKEYSQSFIEKFLEKVQGKSIHIVGVTGSEGSSILRLLSKYSVTKITVHDYIDSNHIEKSYKLWHKGISVDKRNKLYKQFLTDLKQVTVRFGSEYLKDVETADIVFVPQSWRLYHERNIKLFQLNSNKVPFYSITRLYLDFSPCRVIAVTGTVGKGSTSYLIYELLKQAGEDVYLAGNDTWSIQLADQLFDLKQNAFLVLEISHRQLQDGFSRAPYIALFTNIYPNHLDEMKWDKYKNLKYSLFIHQKQDQFSVLNYDNIPVRELGKRLTSKVLYFSLLDNKLNTKDIQNIYSKIKNIKSDHYLSNILSALLIGKILNINIDQYWKDLIQLPPLPARRQLVETINGVKIIDDLKSTTPWATIAAVSLIPKTILICGGRPKGIDYSTFSREVPKYVKKIILIKSELSEILQQHLPNSIYQITNDLRSAIVNALKLSEKGDSILISPGGAFFYTDFIKGKESIRKIIISLPQEGLTG